MFYDLAKTYEGSYLSRNIQYTVISPEALAPEGYFLVVYPKREDARFLQCRDERLKDYHMGKKNKAHRFCPECSSSVLIGFEKSDVKREWPYLAMDAPLFKDIGLEQTAIHLFDGKTKLDPPYEG